MTDESQSPTDEARAKFLLQHSIDHIGYMDTLSNLDGDTAGQNLRCLEIDFTEGVRRAMQNKREHGFHPINAFEHVIKEDYPDWIVEEIAESEHNIFAGGDPEFMSDEEREYLDFLEEEFGVPL